MSTECTATSCGFHLLGRRQVGARFDGGDITSDGGGLWLREVEKRTGMVRQWAACLADHREGERIEHPVEELGGPRGRGLARGYEDRHDQDRLRSNPLCAVLAGQADPSGESRRRAADRGKALAGQSTLNRWELTPADAPVEARYKKMVRKPEAIDRLRVEVFWQAHPEGPRTIVLDRDATDDPLHGQPEGRFFHGY